MLEWFGLIMVGMESNSDSCHGTHTWSMHGLTQESLATDVLCKTPWRGDTCLHPRWRSNCLDVCTCQGAWPSPFPASQAEHRHHSFWSYSPHSGLAQCASLSSAWVWMMSSASFCSLLCSLTSSWSLPGRLLLPQLAWFFAFWPYLERTGQDVSFLELEGLQPFPAWATTPPKTWEWQWESTDMRGLFYRIKNLWVQNEKERNVKRHAVTDMT